jgi:hypothetical protein
MRVPARNQRQIDTRHINEQRNRDKEDANPETPIAMGAFPIRTMVMVNIVLVRSFLVMRVRALTHWFPTFSIPVSKEFGAAFQTATGNDLSSDAGIEPLLLIVSL